MRQCVTYQGIIFDFNGVLLWDTELHVQSWQEVAQDLRGRALTEAECAVHVHGRPVSYVLSYLIGREVKGRELHELSERKEALYRRLCLDNPRTFALSPGAKHLLDELVEKSIPRTIATSSGKTNLDFFIRHLDLARWFDVGRIVYDDGVRPGKPAPDMYLAATANIGTAPRDCIVVEDAISGLQAAQRAAIGCIIALGPPKLHQTLRACEGVSAVITSLAHFPFRPLLVL